MKIEKIEKLIVNLHDKTEFAIHIRNLKQTLNHRLVSKEVHRAGDNTEKIWAHCSHVPKACKMAAWCLRMP